jgi:hypothetical protein
MDANGNWLDPDVAQMPIAWGCDDYGTTTITPTMHRSTWNNIESEACCWTYCFGYREDKLSEEYTTADLVTKLSSDLASAAYSDWTLGEPSASFNLSSYKACGDASKFKARISLTAPPGFNCELKYTLQTNINGVITHGTFSGTPSHVGGGGIFRLELPEVIPTEPGMIISLVAVEPIYDVASLTPTSNNAILWSIDPTENKEIWVVRVGSGDVIVTATSSPYQADEGLLPSCWSFTGGTAINQGKLQRKTDTLTPKVVEFNLSTGCSSRTIELIVYRAKFTIMADQGNAWAIEVGHAWWEIDLQPSRAIDLLTPGSRNYVGEAGFWPNFTVTPWRIEGPGMVVLDDQGPHPVTGYYTWETTIDHLQPAIDYVRTLYFYPPNYHLHWHNCVHEAITIGNSYFQLSIPYMNTPWDLSDYLNSLW